MEILAGVLLLVAIIFNFLGLAIDSELTIIIHIVKFIIGAIAIVILFNIGVPSWMYIVSILSVGVGFLGGCIASSGSLVAFPMIIIGFIGNIIVGISLFF